MVKIAVLINGPSHPAHLCTTQGEKQDRTQYTACSTVLGRERVVVVRSNKYQLPTQHNVPVGQVIFQNFRLLAGPVRSSKFSQNV